MLTRLSKSKFRSSFRLKAADIDYARAKGRGVIESHARDLLLKRLAPAQPRNDGKQTPLSGSSSLHCPACHRDLLPWLFGEMASY